MKPSEICLHIDSLTSFAFLEYQTSGFYHISEANLVSLLIYIAWKHITSFTSMFFSRNTWLVINILFIKLEFNCVHASKKKSIPDWHLCITQMEKKWTKWFAMTSHVIAYRQKELLFGTHAFNYTCSCFLDDINYYLRRYAAYLYCWSLLCGLSSPICGGYSSSQSTISSSHRTTIWHSLSPCCNKEMGQKLGKISPWWQ